MSQQRIEAFLDECGVSVVAGTERERFLAGEGVRILFMTGDVEQRPDVGDLTVVLREILRDYAGRVQVALADRAEETLFREQFGIRIFPNMVFFRDGQPMGMIPGMKPWDDYLGMVKRLLGEAADEMIEVDPFQQILLEMKRFTGF
ncbi:MAG: hypothetical protein Kow006_22260 [Gammaproteobacteria bacterium]